MRASPYPEVPPQPQTRLTASAALTIPVGVIGPVLAGWIFDTTGSYEIAFLLFAITLGMSAVIMLFVTPPKPPQGDPSP